MLCDIILVYEKNRDVSVVKTAYSPQAFGDFLIELKNKGGLSVSILNDRVLLRFLLLFPHFFCTNKNKWQRQTENI